MSRSGQRLWGLFSLLGILLWVGATVLVAVVNDDASDPRPILLTFAAGGGLFFAVVFGVAFWQTRPRTDRALDALLNELTLEEAAIHHLAVSLPMTPSSGLPARRQT